MDGITQAVLGAAVGYAACGHRLGRKAAWWGALGGILPDADILVAAPFDAFTGLWMHRGTSHSVWFGWVVGPMLGYAVWRYYLFKERRSDNDTQLPPGCLPAGSVDARRWWMLLFALALFTHPLLDVFTSYGTQLLAPFSRKRFVFDGVGIIDPVYTGVLVLGLVLARRRRDRPPAAQRVLRWSLLATTAYVLVGAGLSIRAQRFATQDLLTRHHSPTEAALRVDAYTQPLQLGLKRVVAQDDEQMHVGYVSAISPSPIHWWSFPRNPSRRAPPELVDAADRLVVAVAQTEEAELFTWFSDKHICASLESRPSGGSIVIFDDVRYGWPGNPTQGFWAIRAELDAEENVIEIRRLNRERKIPDDALGDLFRAAWGHDARTFMVGSGGTLPSER